MSFPRIIGKTITIKSVYDGKEILEELQRLGETNTEFTGQIIIEAITQNEKISALLLINKGQIVAVSTLKPITSLDEVVYNILAINEGYLEIQELDKTKIELALEYLPKNTSLVLNEKLELSVLLKKAKDLLKEKEEKKEEKIEETIETKKLETTPAMEDYEWILKITNPNINTYSQNYKDNIMHIYVNILRDIKIPLEEVKGKKLRDVLATASKKSSEMYIILNIPSDCVGERAELHFCKNQIIVAVTYANTFEIKNIGMSALKEIAESLNCKPQRPYRLYTIPCSTNIYKKIQEKIGCKIETEYSKSELETKKEKKTKRSLFSFRLFKK